MNLTLKTKVASVVTVLVIALVAIAEWSEGDQLGREYLALLQRQQQSTVDQVADDLDAKLALHLSVLDRAARGVTAASLQSVARDGGFAASFGGARALFSGIALVNLQGEIIDYDPPRQAPQKVSVADREYFNQVVATGRPSISRPLIARTSGEPAVVMSAPVQDAEGRAIAVVSAGLNLLHPGMLGSLRKARVGESGYFVLRTRGEDSLYVAHPETALLLQPAAAAERGGGAAAVAVSGGDAPATAKRSLKNIDWDLEVVMPAAEAYAPLRRAHRGMLLQTLLLGLVTAGIIWGATFWMLRPLSRLHAAVRREGEVVREIAPSTLRRDEIGDLARAFSSVVTRLQQRKAELRAVHDASPMGLFHCDLHGDVTYANDAYFKIQGLSRENFATSWYALVPADAKAQVIEAWRQDLQRPVAYEAQLSATRPEDAAPLLLKIRRAPVLLNGELVGHAGTVEDITDRVAHERAQRHLTAVFDSTPDFVAQTDPRGRIVYLNRAARLRCGIALDADVTHLSVADFHPPEEVARLTSEVLPAALAHGVWSGETVGLSSDGRHVPFSHVVIAHRDRNGRIERFSGVLRDIAAQKAASADLSRSEQTLRSIAEALPALVAVVDARETCRYANSAFGAWFLSAPETLVGHTLREVIGAVDYDRNAPYVRRALAGEAVVFEESYADRGPVQFREVTYIPLRTASFGTDGFVIIANDITARKHQEQGLREQALCDPLTGLLNRAGFDAAIARLTCGHGTTEARSLSVLYIDLDHFKAVNDRHGHAAGDEVLRAFAKRLRGCVRPTDPVCRLGGDEFAVLLAAVDTTAQAERIAAKVVETAEQSFELEGASIFIGASVGVAVSQGGQSPRELIATADAMLYAAKREGRGRHMLAH